MPLHGLPLTRHPQYTPFCWQEGERLRFTGAHFSHRLGHDAHDLLNHPGWAEEARSWVRDLRSRGQEVWMWTHEFHQPPAECVNPEKKFLFDDSDWEGHLRRKYRTFLTTTLPGITGLVFTFAETTFEIYKDDRVVSKLSAAERLRRLMEVLVSIGQEHGVRIAVRDFVYRLPEVEAMAEAIRGLPSEVAVMSKAVPHDWQPFYPPNPILGRCGDREQWVEFDLGLEYEGQQMHPYANLEQIASWYQAAHDQGIRHFCLRFDRYDGEKGQSALSTPWGQLALSAFVTWEKDPSTSLQTIYRGWEKSHFEGASQVVQLATASVQKMIFPMKNWLSNHCQVPRYGYAKSHLVDGNADRLATWTGAPEDIKVRDQLIRMPREFRLTLEKEALESIGLFQQAKEIVTRNLDSSHPAAQIWQEGFRMLGSYLRIFRAYRSAFFLIREYEENGSAAESPPTIVAAINHFDAVSRTEAHHWKEKYFTGRSFWTTHYPPNITGKQSPYPPEDYLLPVTDNLRQILAALHPK